MSLLVNDWVAVMRAGQTRKARASRKGKSGRPALEVPAFYAKLTLADQQALQQAYERREQTVPELATLYGTTKPTIYRLARILKWENTGKDVGKN